jgi:GAF domain-containing protein
MPFAAGLRQSLSVRDRQLASEFSRGDSLQEVLDRHLLAVEEMAESDLLTSVLLLSPDGQRLSHGAGPSLPLSYRQAVDGSVVGPSAGSCGTAAFLNRPVYVTDIATDPLWTDYRHLAIPHGLRSCWSTPIHDTAGTLIGTFAIYHRTARGPTREELHAIDLITNHVAQAIVRARATGSGHCEAPRLRLVCDNPLAPTGPLERLLTKLARLEAMVAQLERQPMARESREARAEMRNLANNSRKLADIVRGHVRRLRDLMP